LIVIFLNNLVFLNGLIVGKNIKLIGHSQLWAPYQSYRVQEVAFVQNFWQRSGETAQIAGYLFAVLAVDRQSSNSIVFLIGMDINTRKFSKLQMFPIGSKVFRFMAISAGYNMIFLAEHRQSKVELYYYEFDKVTSLQRTQDIPESPHYVSDIEMPSKVLALKCKDHYLLVGDSTYSFQLYKLEKTLVTGNTVYCGANYTFSENKPRFLLGGNFLDRPTGYYAGVDKFGTVFLSNYEKKTELVKADNFGNFSQDSNIYLGSNLINEFSRKILDVSKKVLELPGAKAGLGSGGMKLGLVGVNGLHSVIEKKDLQLLGADFLFSAVLTQFSNFLESQEQNFAKQEYFFLNDKFSGDGRNLKDLNDNCLSSRVIERFLESGTLAERTARFEGFIKKFPTVDYKYENVESILNILVCPE
jgi:hypothetical protein